MRYFIGIIVLLVCLIVYGMTYIINSKQAIDIECKRNQCHGCGMNCKQRSEDNGTTY